MSGFKINVDDAKEKHVPNEEESKEILDYLQANDADPEAISEMMRKYNCTRMSINRIVMRHLTNR
jgi:Mor family transcriptional regulator